MSNEEGRQQARFSLKRFLSENRAALVVVGTSLVILALLALSYALGRSTGNVLAKCPTLENPPQSSGQAIQLQSNKARPSLSVSLLDQASAVDDISFSPRETVAIPDKVRAYIISYPRNGDHRSSADIGVLALSAAGATTVQLRVCIKRGDLWEAGTYEGAVRIFGGGVKAFDYPLIISERWPWESAIALLLVALDVFLLITIYSNSLMFGKKGRTAGAFPTVLGILLAAAAITPTFFGSYWNNETWGANPGTQVSGLVVAGFTAAAAGLALAHRLITQDTSKSESDATGQGEQKREN
jgi:hypothetical protein